MSNEYVWLPKEDSVYKEYKEKGWHTVLSVKTISNNIYFCYSNTQHFVSEEASNKLLVPICIINEEYKNCIITFDEDHNDGFIWKDNKCFSISREMIDQIVNSKMFFFKDDPVIKVESISQLVSDAEIKVKSSMLQYYLLTFAIIFLSSISFGIYLWLL